MSFGATLAAEHREAAGVAAGDEVDVDVELDIGELKAPSRRQAPAPAPS